MRGLLFDSLENKDKWASLLEETHMTSCTNVVGY